jgi:hypothetical protein
METAGILPAIHAVFRLSEFLLRKNSKKWKQPIHADHPVIFGPGVFAEQNPQGIGNSRPLVPAHPCHQRRNGNAVSLTADTTREFRIYCQRWYMRRKVRLHDVMRNGDLTKFTQSIIIEMEEHYEGRFFISFYNIIDFLV